MTSAEMFARARELIGDPVEAAKRSEQLKRNVIFATSHEDTWRKTVPNHWVGVHHAKLVASAKSYEGLLRALEAKRLPSRDVYKTFVSEKKYLLAL